MEVGQPDGPKADELVLALVMTTGPRVHARVGGLKASEIKGEDWPGDDQSFDPQAGDHRRRGARARWAGRSIRRPAAPLPWPSSPTPSPARYVEDLTPLMEIGEELGDLLGRRAVAALGIEGPAAESYGKAAAVGENGELEHAAAILHPRLGAPLRKVLGKARRWCPPPRSAVVPALPSTCRSATRTPPMSAAISTAWRCASTTRRAPTRSVVAVVVTDSGRPLPRIGGLTKAEIKGEDGLR